MEEVPELGRGVGSPRAHLAARVARAVRSSIRVMWSPLPGDGDGRVAALSPSTNPASLGDPGWVNHSSVVVVGHSLVPGRKGGGHR